jgi:hypothetical protein
MLDMAVNVFGEDTVRGKKWARRVGDPYRSLG